MTSQEKQQIISDLETIKELARVSDNSITINLVLRIMKKLQDDWNNSDWYYNAIMQELNS